MSRRRRIPSAARRLGKPYVFTGTGYERTPRSKLEHVDYNCGGIVRHDSVIGLRCTKCNLTSAFGPFTVVTVPG